jgi:hypothetical protein
MAWFFEMYKWPGNRPLLSGQVRLWYYPVLEKHRDMKKLVYATDEEDKLVQSIRCRPKCPPPSGTDGRCLPEAAPNSL